MNSTSSTSLNDTKKNGDKKQWLASLLFSLFLVVSSVIATTLILRSFGFIKDHSASYYDNGHNQHHSMQHQDHQEDHKYHHQDIQQMQRQMDQLTDLVQSLQMQLLEVATTEGYDDHDDGKTTLDGKNNKNNKMMDIEKVEQQEKEEEEEGHYFPFRSKKKRISQQHNEKGQNMRTDSVDNEVIPTAQRRRRMKKKKPKKEEVDDDDDDGDDDDEESCTCDVNVIIIDSNDPTTIPSSMPSLLPSPMPSLFPSSMPSSMPSLLPSSPPSSIPSSHPSTKPSHTPSDTPSGMPSGIPSSRPSQHPSLMPSPVPSAVPSNNPTTNPSDPPTDMPVPPPEPATIQVEVTLDGDLPQSYTWASLYGIVGDCTTDDTLALQAALNAAGDSLDGGTVILPEGVFSISSTLMVPPGVTVQGQGYGPNPLQIQPGQAGGSTIAYCGPEYAVQMTGHASSLRDLAIYGQSCIPGCDSSNPITKGGVLLEADGIALESIYMSNVLIYFFFHGINKNSAALTLRGIHGGGIAYCNFQNLRIRNGDIGILLEADDDTPNSPNPSFVNSNSFLAGAISGGITTSCVMALGPGACNDNKFLSMVIEPYETELAHIYVHGEKTNVRFLDVRLEGQHMDEFVPIKPLVVIDDTSSGNVFTGLIGHTHVQANMNRNPGIDLMSAKSIGLDPAPYNQFWNSAFKLSQEENLLISGAGNEFIPGWVWGVDNNNIVVPDDVTIITDEAQLLYSNHYVLEVSITNTGPIIGLRPSSIMKSLGHDMAAFGIYAKTNVPGGVFCAMKNSNDQTVSSASHSGNGQWEFVGMTSFYSKTSSQFYVGIDTSLSPLTAPAMTVQLTAPILIYGETPGTPGASFLSTSGGQMSGTLSLGMMTYIPPSDDPSTAVDNYWTLPLGQGNIFQISYNSNDENNVINPVSKVLSRLNYSVDRYPVGTVITLLFKNDGFIIQNSVFIQLLNNQGFTSAPNSSITLVSVGTGLWQEISRNI